MSGETDKNDQMRSGQPNPLGSPTTGGDSISVGVGDSAKNVAAGKNIVQIGSLSIPRWAVLSIGAVLALVAVLVGAVAYFSQQTGASTRQAAAILAYTPTPTPTVTLVPTVTPTAPPFAPAADGETMIVILPFHTTAATDSEVHKKIWRRIQDLLTQKMPDKPVTAVIDPNTVLTADQQAEAEIVGKRYNASMVIWGEDTGVELIASFLNLREPDFAAADVDIDETKRTQVANPSQYAEFVTRELPGQLAFLALFAVGQTYYINNDYPSAIDAIESAIAAVSSPNDQDLGDQATVLSKGVAQGYFYLGWLYQEALNNLDAAIADYNQAIALDPQNADAYTNRGVAYANKDDLDQAIADLTQAINLDPQNADAYGNRGKAYRDKGDLDQAIADLTQAIILNPWYAFAYYNRGNTYHDKGELDRAIADYNRAISLDPQDALAYNNRGLAYYDKGDLDHAIVDYNQAIILNPQNAAAYNNRGTAHSGKGKLDQAIVDFNKAIALDRMYALAYNNRGNAYNGKCELDQAIADYSQAITLDPMLTVAYYNRGIAYNSKGELDQAIADYTRVIVLDPKDAYAYYNRGITYHAKGALDKANADRTKAIELDPHLADK